MNKDKIPFPDSDMGNDAFEALIMYNAFKELTDDTISDGEVYDDREIEFSEKGAGHYGNKD